MLVMRLAVGLAAWVAGLALKVLGKAVVALCSLTVTIMAKSASASFAVMRRAADRAEVARVNARVARLRRRELQEECELSLKSHFGAGVGKC